MGGSACIEVARNERTTSNLWGRRTQRDSSEYSSRDSLQKETAHVHGLKNATIHVDNPPNMVIDGTRRVRRELCVFSVHGKKRLGLGVTFWV